MPLVARITEIGFNLCFILLTGHACAQLVQLGNTIQAHDGKIRHSAGENILPGCSCLKCIVNTHVRIHDFVVRIDSYFHKTMFLQLSQSVIQVSIVGFIAAEAFVNQNYPRLIQYAFYMLMNFPTFLLYCWMADIVQQTSESLGDIVYSTEWTRRDPKIARNLMLIILYSRVPLKLTAGKFFVLDLSFFREVLRFHIDVVSISAGQYQVTSMKVFVVVFTSDSEVYASSIPPLALLRPGWREFFYNWRLYALSLRGQTQKLDLTRCPVGNYGIR
ncbi:odorant receptor 45b-like [Diachasmimorpha longicaudata]|uniref:odorant receptor 45b-like n=1 Tax=Diachasmimorpha longicaudata TaxID=58733 RepID=UPI0030B8845D